MKRTPIRKVSKKRAGQNRLYAMLRPRYLNDHPWCQIFMMRFGLKEEDIKQYNGAYKETTNDGMNYWKIVPLATEIHHTKKPKSTYLCDQSTWLSACREQHEWVENNKGKARELGLLQNI